MKRFLIFLMAAVLVLTTATFPAAGALPLDQQETVQPAVLGERTTYHICFRDDGSMLGGSTGSVTANRYAQSNTSLQWIFEEYYSYVFVIYSAASPGYVLAVNPATRSVRMEPYSAGNEYQLWTINYTSSGTMLETYSTDSRISGKCLFSSGYPYTASVESSGSPLELISPSITLPTTVTLSDAYVVHNRSKYIMPQYTSGAAYTDSSWWIFSSANSSICSVDEYGILIGMSPGSTTITVTHMITRATATCTVDVWNIIQVSGLIYHNDNCSMETASQTSAVSSAIADIANEFGIQFSFGTPSMNFMLDLSSSCAAQGSPYKYAYEICGTACGDNANCYNSHHKAAYKLNEYSSTPGFYTIRMVDYAVCRMSTTHDAIGGCGDPNGWDSLICIPYAGDIAATIQHELSHNLGTVDGQCSSEKCVIKSDADMGYWCNNCKAAIINRWR